MVGFMGSSEALAGSVALLPAPSVRVVPSASVYGETTTNNTGELNIVLSEPFVEDVWVNLATAPAGQSNIVLSTMSAIRIPSGLTNAAVAVKFSIPDGTLSSEVTGVEIVPTVTNTPAQTYFTDVQSATVYVSNVCPRIAKPLTADTPTASLGVPFAINWSVADVPADGPSMRVTWDFGDGSLQTVTGLSGVVSHKYVWLGANVVTVRAEDKDGGVSDEIQFTVDVGPPPPLPSVSIIPPDGPLEETSTPNTGSFIVHLSEPFTNTVTVGLTVTPGNGAASGTLTLTTNRAYFAVGVTERVVQFSAKDGTALSFNNGFTVTPAVLATPSAAAYYSECMSGLVQLPNVPPVIMTPAASTTVVYTIPQGTPYSFFWNVSDVAADLAAMSVTWYFGDGATSTLTGGSGSVAHTFTASGEMVVRMVALDKDGGRSEVQFKVCVAPAKTVYVTPQGPNIQVSYWDASGLGNGMVYSPEARSSQHRNNFYIFRFDPAVMSASLSAVPYKAGSTGYTVTNFNGVGVGVPGAFTLYDSFFYTWAGTGQGLAEQNLNPATASPTAVVTLSDVDRDIQAIFSREYRIADNMGDINQDGIPDKIAARYFLPHIASGGTNDGTGAPVELLDVGQYNGDNDFLPGVAGGVLSNVYAAVGAPFTAMLEVRGFHPGLNNENYGSDPDYGPGEWKGDEPQTDPTQMDTDGDNFPDGWEYYFFYQANLKGMSGCAYNPLNVASGTLISYKVIVLSFDPLVPAVSANDRDLDNDGLTDAEELATGTNPIHWDTDGDGLSDGWEVLHELNPFDPSDARPVFTPASGATATDAFTVQLATIDGAEIHYTLDGSTPTSSSALYQSGTPLVLTQSATVNAIVVRPGMLDSAVVSATYTVCVSAPVFTPGNGTIFVDELEVSISCPTRGAKVLYTVDGSEPGESNGDSREYTGVILLSCDSATVKAKAFLEGLAASETVVAYFHKTKHYFVDASRPDDSDYGLTWATAKKTLQAAAALAFDSDVVWVADGTYDLGSARTPGAELDNRMVIARAFTVRSVNGAEKTRIRGSQAEVRCVYMGGGVLDGFTLEYGAARTGAASDVCGAGLYATNAVIRNCIMQYNTAPAGLGGGAYVLDCVVSNCVVRQNSAHMGGGVFASNSLIVACVIQDNKAVSGYGGGLCGGSVSDSVICENRGEMGAVCDAEVYNSVIYGHYGPGFSGGGAYNCIIWMNTSAYCSDRPPHHMVNCLTDVDIIGPADGSYVNNISGDPLFVDAANGNFRLRPTSPCRDAGNNAYVQSVTDLAGNPRISNGTVDMGAYESRAATVTFDAQGGDAVIPTSKTVTEGEPYGELPKPTYNENIFAGWWTERGGIGTRVTSASLVTTNVDHTLYASWILGQPPRITKRVPLANPAAIFEGASAVLSVTADDSTDPDAARRGMSNVVWYVDGTLKQETRTGAPNAILSAFTLKTDTNTVRGVAFRNVTVKAVAQDRQGFVAETNWTVCVSNALSAQTITFKALPVVALGTTNFSPGATASSGLPVGYTSSGPSVAEIVDGRIRIAGAGTTVITASQPGNFDFRAALPMKQTLIVKARLAAEIIGGTGTVTGAGLYLPGSKVTLTARPALNNTFLRWENGSQTPVRNLTMPNANLTVSARFGLTTNVPPPVIAAPGAQQAMVGLLYTLPLDIQSESLPTVTVTGLPAGLSYNATAQAIAGVPTLAVSNKVVTITARNVNRIPATNTFALTVSPLPLWAQGNFNGWFGAGASDFGPMSADVTALGKVTGKFSSFGTNFIFSAASYTQRDGDGAFWLTTTAKVAQVSLPLTLAVRRPAGVVPPSLSVADGWFAGAAAGDPAAALWRNVWKDAGMAAVATNYTGYYTATLPGGSEYGSGYLLFTVDKLGGVKTTGKLADGTAVSLSSVLIMDEDGRVFTVLYAAPTAYKGGSLFGVAEFYKAAADVRVIVRPLDGVSFRWESYDPQATEVYRDGFSRDLGLAGGWYDTVGNLYDYYWKWALSISTDGAPVPQADVGINSYASIWWNPDGLVLSVVTNRLGVMTGLSAPAAGVPVKVGTNTYEYAGVTNAVGLTISLTRATGVFKGSFKAWFDYAATHTPRLIAYEGVLTPEQEDAGSGVAGRGFFLWPDKSQYLNPLGTPVPYSFNWSYDLKILLSDIQLPDEMVRVQGGSLPDIGNGAITVSSFYIGKYEVTWAGWQTVRDWAATNGYDIGSIGAGSATNHPVRTVSWYDCVKWCNARSQKEGRTPVYYTDAGFSLIYKTGEVLNPFVNAATAGYRLPTDAEWEFAARGGTQSLGYEYSGGNNLYAVGWYGGNSSGAAVDLDNGQGTWPVGTKAANELGLYDMSGNVLEWCFDWYPGYEGSYRVTRGGSLFRNAVSCRSAFRSRNTPGVRYSDFGFRAARTLP